MSVRQSLRPPVLSARALGGRDLDRLGLTYLFERTTADDPFRRDRQTGSPLLELAKNRADAEDQIDRVVFAPAARSYEPSAWVHPAVDASDSTLDRLAGLEGAERFDSSGRFHDLPRYRASSAFDADPHTAWLGIWARPAAPFPWIGWSAERPIRVSRLRLAPPDERVRRPTEVRLSWPGGSTPALPVGADGDVTLPRPVRARAFRLTVLDTAFPSGADERERSTRAVGIGSLTVPGLAAASVPRSGPLRTACGDVRVEVGGRAVPLRPRGTVEQLDAGRPLQASGCDGAAAMGDGHPVRPLAAGRVQRRPAAPALARAGRAAGRGRRRRPSWTPARSPTARSRACAWRSTGPSWLVLGQSYSKGWRAECDGRDLGEPEPIDGYANGWRAPADCRDVAFSYAPRSRAAGYAISAVVCALLLAFLLVGPPPARAAAVRAHRPSCRRERDARPGCRCRAQPPLALLVSRCRWPACSRSAARS